MLEQKRSGLMAYFNRKLVPAVALPALFLITGCGFDANAPVGGGSDPGQATQTPTSTATPIVAVATPASVEATATVAPVSTSQPTSDSASGYSVSVTLNATDTHPISPLIYGIADPTSGDEDTLQWLGAGLARWGGNARDMHNWDINDSSTGVDGQYQNVKQGDNKPGSASLAFLTRNAGLGLGSILTIPTIGWVAKDGASQSQNVPAHGGPPITAGSDIANTVFKDPLWSKPYDPAANRQLTSVQSFPSKGAPFAYPPDLNDGKVYQDEWTAHLKSAAPKNSAPTIYAMDNEPELWADNTHVDVSPVRLGYDSELANFLTYSHAIKKVDPSALVAGPESWGVTGYLYSALDEGGDNFATAADRAAHGDVPWIDWFLRSVSDSDKKQGSRSLDVVTLHYYPTEGGMDAGNDPASQDARMQGPRALWDGLYTVPGWVGRTEWGNLGLLRRMNGLISADYPGTKLGLTEWNFGGENDISGAIATADALGIFGREGLYLASYWGLPAKGSPTGWAFRMYSNYDGKGGKFGSESVATTGDNTESFSAYGALDNSGNKLTVMLINKDRARAATATLNISGFSPASSASVYSYDGKSANGPVSQSLAISGQPVHVTVPPMTISMVELPGGPK